MHGLTPPTPGDFVEEFLGLYFHDPAVGMLRASEAQLVASARLPTQLLDLGCGDGSFAARALAQPVAVGVDRDLQRLRRARASGAYRAVVVADAHRLPFRDDCFAAVLSNSTLEHIPGVGDVLREVERVLRPGGRLLFTLHNHRFGERMFFWPALFRLLGRERWIEPYRRARMRRLGMANLMSADEWRALLVECGLPATQVRGYLAGPTNDAFEALLVLARFGLGRFNLSAGLRLLDRGLASIAVTGHRRLLGRLLARPLRAVATQTDGQPAAIAVEATPFAVAMTGAVAAVGGDTAVVDLARYRRGRG